MSSDRAEIRNPKSEIRNKSEICNPGFGVERSRFKVQGSRFKVFFLHLLPSRPPPLRLGSDEQADVGDAALCPVALGLLALAPLRTLGSRLPVRKFRVQGSRF